MLRIKIQIGIITGLQSRDYRMKFSVSVYPYSIMPIIECIVSVLKRHKYRYQMSVFVFFSLNLNFPSRQRIGAVLDLYLKFYFFLYVPWIKSNLSLQFASY